EVAEDAHVSSSGREAVAAPVDANANEKGIVLAGRVLDVPVDVAVEQGRGAAGVPVRIRWHSKPETTSDADGAFRIVVPDAGNRPVAVELAVDGDDDFRQATVSCSLQEGERARTDLVLARRAHGAIEGRTIDLAGRPVAGVAIKLFGWRDPKRGAVIGE